MLAAFAAQTFSMCLIVPDYYSNKTAFVKKCENKARPQLLCKGKCQMLKKLKEEEKKDSKTLNAGLKIKTRSFLPALILQVTCLKT